MEIICINDNFDSENLNFWNKYGVVHPTEGKMYTLRERIKDSSGNWGLRLEELKNPQIPVDHNILGGIMWEPTFNSKRFATLMGETIEFKKESIETFK